MLGDSTAAGYGVHRDVETPGVQLAMRLSAVSGRPVHLTSVAVVGGPSRPASSSRSNARSPATPTSW